MCHPRMSRRHDSVEVWLKRAVCGMGDGRRGRFFWGRSGLGSKAWRRRCRFVALLRHASSCSCQPQACRSLVACYDRVEEVNEVRCLKAAPSPCSCEGLSFASHFQSSASLDSFKQRTSLITQSVSLDTQLHLHESPLHKYIYQHEVLHLCCRRRCCWLCYCCSCCSCKLDLFLFILLSNGYLTRSSTHCSIDDISLHGPPCICT